MTTIASYNHPGNVQAQLLLQILQRELAAAGGPPDDMVRVDPEGTLEYAIRLPGILKSIRGEEES